MKPTLKSWVMVVASLCLFVNAYCQTEPVTTSNLQLPAFNILNDSRYTIRAEIVSKYVTTYTILKNNDQATKKSFTLNPNTIESFEENFRRVFTELAGADGTVVEKTTGKPDVLKTEARQLFFQYMAAERTVESLDIPPNAGRLLFKKDVRVKRKTFTEAEIDNKVKKILKAIKGKDLCVTPALTVPGNADIKIPCGLAKSKFETRKEWRARIKDFWVTTMEAAINQDLKNTHDDYLRKVEEIGTATATMKGDSVLLKRIMPKLVDSDASIPRLAPRIEFLKKDIFKDSIAIVTSMPLRILPRIALLKMYLFDDVNSLLTQIAARKVTLSAEHGLVRTGIAVTQDSITRNTQLNSTASLARRNSHQQDLDLQNARLTSVQNDIDELDRLTTTVNRIYSSHIDLQQLKLDLARYQNDQTTLAPLLIAINGRLTVANRSLATLVADKAKLCSDLARKRREQLYADFTVSKITLDFNDGFIENMVVEGELKYASGDCSAADSKENLFLKFNSSYPMGFSRKIDYRAYKRFYSVFATSSELVNYELAVREIIPEYVEELKTDRRDYSPKDYVVTIDFTSGQNSITLLKDETFKLFEAKVYTDFVGISDDREPNGLVQTEISRKVFLNTWREKIFKRKAVTWGYAGYIEPEVTFSKIENNNRRLLLDIKDKFINSQYNPLKYASTLDLRRYQVLSAGVDGNFASLDIPLIKSVFHLDGGFRYGRTLIRDSLRTANDDLQVIRERRASDYGVNTLDIYPKITWEVKSDERYCFSFSYQRSWFFLRDNRFTQVANGETYAVTEQEMKRVRNEYTRIGLNLTINPSDSRGRIFCRYNYYWQQGFWRTGFHQAQIGYSFYLIGHKN